MVGSRLLYHSAGECKRIFGRQDTPLLPQPHSGGSDYVLETSAFRPDVIRGVSCLDVFVIGPAIEHNVAICDNISSIRVVIDGIGIENVCAVVNLRLPAQFEHGAIFFLLQSLNRNILLLCSGGRGWRGWRWWSVSLFRGGKQLAGNYGRSE